MTSLTDLAPRVRFNEQLLAVLAKDMDAAAWAARPGGGGNAAHWILCHLVASRRFMARMAGADLPAEDWEASFGRGADPGADTAGHPAVDAMLAAFTAAGEAVSARLPAMTEAEASAASPRPFPDGSETVEAGLHFLYFHETYHLGQLGLLRRMNGLEGFA